MKKVIINTLRLVFSVSSVDLSWGNGYTLQKQKI